MSRAPWGAALLALMLALPAAAAHVGSLPQGTVMRVGPYSVAFSPNPENPYVNDTVSVTLQVAEAATGLQPRAVELSITITPPGGEPATHPVRADGTGYFVAAVPVRVPGAHEILLQVRNTTSGETHEAPTRLEVFPDLGFRIRSVDPNLDIYVGRTTPLAVETVDPFTLRRVAFFDDLVIVAEHWTDDHSRMLESETLATENPSPGLFRVDHVFEKAGMYHLRFSSEAGGFKPDDVPLLHAVAVPPADEPPTQETPLPALLALLALAGVAALRRR